jgi:hypothetical protein
MFLQDESQEPDEFIFNLFLKIVRFLWLTLYNEEHDM